LLVALPAQLSPLAGHDGKVWAVTVTLPALSGIVLVYLLVFARVGSMVMLLPAIGEATVPTSVRLVLSLAISYALAPVVAQHYNGADPKNALQLGLLVVQEVMAGLLVGVMARVIMSALYIAGDFIATQTGLSYATTLDPTQGSSTPVAGTFMSLLGVVMIFGLNLHHLAIGAIQGSFQMIPPGAELPVGDMADLTVKLASGAFAMGFQLAAPFIVFSFAVNVAIGILARMMPQLQVFFVAMPINILAGFLILLLLLGSLMNIFLDYYTHQMAFFIQ
jgi:flagellar biosynthetic protein FliR